MRNLKRVLSLALALVMVLGMMVITTSAADFTDADEITYEEAIDVMAGLGLFKGDNGALKPQEVLTREEAATLMARIMLGEKTADKLVATKQIFADVPANDWAAKYIEYCYNTGLIGGYTVNGELVFNPDGKLTGVAFAKLLLCAMGYDANAQGYGGSNWASAIAADAFDQGLTIDGVVISADLTREGAAQMILQALECDMVDYDTYYDYATGAPILAGHNPVTVDEDADDYNENPRAKTDDTLQFCEKYFPGLVKTNSGNETTWGRPYDYEWEYTSRKVTTTTLYTAWEEAAAVYVEATSQCDIAKDVNIDDKYTFTTYTNGYDNDDDLTITATNTRAKVGAQGQLVEVYEDDIVIIDTYFAIVADVDEAEFDKNGHLEVPAVLTLKVWTDETPETVYVESEEDWDYKKFETLLVNAVMDEYGIATVESEYIDEDVVDHIEFVGEPDAIDGVQTELTTKASHVVEDDEYMDAVNFYKDEAGRDGENEYTWYFDQYGNLIANAEIDAIYNFGVLTSIYWKDSFDGEDGYAVGTITYMDGESEKVTVYAAEGFKDTTKDRKGVENVLTSKSISETKAENKEFCNLALYMIQDTKNGVILTETTEIDATIETGVSVLERGEAYADKTTMFLVWTGKGYETYTGIRNIPTYETTKGVWAAEIDAKDSEAEYVFVIEPEAEADKDSVLYFNTDVNDVHTSLKNEVYTVYGGYVNNEKDVAIEIEYTDEDYDDNAVWQLLAKYEGCLVVLSLEDGFVVNVTPVTDTEDTLDKGKTYFVYVGEVEADAEINNKETLMYVGDESYDIETATLIGAKNWEKAEGKYAYVVYTEGKGGYKTAEYVYVTKVESLATAQENAVEELVAYIEKTAGEGASADDKTELGLWADNGDKTYKTMADVVATWTDEIYECETIEAVEDMLKAQLDVYDDAGAAAAYIAKKK